MSPALATLQNAGTALPRPRIDNHDPVTMMGTSAFRFSCAVLAALLPTLAPAQMPPIKPGLWEVKGEREGDGAKTAQSADRMKNLSPEVRAKIDAMMKEKGMAPGAGAGGATRVCFTKDSLDAGRWQNSTRCKTDYGARSNALWKWHSVCTEPASVIDGEAVFANAENYTVNTSTTSTFRGEARTSHMTIRAKWVGADCGDLKPFDPKR